MTTPEQTSNPERIIIPIDDELVLMQLEREDAGPMKAVMDFDRQHLKQHGEKTGDKYQTEQEIIDSIVQPEDPSRLRFGIHKHDAFVGSINLHPREPGVGEVGYWIGAEYTRQGIAPKAVRALSEWAFQNGYKTLFGKINPKNVASKSVLQKAGYKYSHGGHDDEGNFVWFFDLESNESPIE